MKRIVLIDDEPGQMDYYCRALRLHHYEVELLDSTDKARVAIESWGSHPPDAVVLDLMLPPGNVFTAQETHNGLTTGVSIYRLIQKKFPSVPIVILSSYEDKVREQQTAFGDSTSKAVSKYEAPPFALVHLLDGIVGNTTKNRDS